MNTIVKKIIPIFVFVAFCMLPILAFAQFAPISGNCEDGFVEDELTGECIAVQGYGTGETGETPAGAGQMAENPAGGTIDNGSYIFTNPLKGHTSFVSIVRALLNALINIGWVVVIFALIYVGFKFVTASGNPSELAKAKTAFMWTVIGGVILLGSMAISEVICNTAAEFGALDPNSCIF